MCTAGAVEVERTGAMKPAGMGRGNEVWHSEHDRGDRITWITGGIRGSGELPQVSLGCSQAADDEGILLVGMCLLDEYAPLPWRFSSVRAYQGGLPNPDPTDRDFFGSREWGATSCIRSLTQTIWGQRRKEEGSLLVLFGEYVKLLDR